jgi:hypothetical protein
LGLVTTQIVKANNPHWFGLGFVGLVPWGTHICQSYETEKDLVDILILYFTEGLRNNEF